ncbi:TRAM domain-containing protein [Corynebacterium breve]|uniref:TRAM domain-containing protein n=1 Tax=Corynebacterium breve TaxID=3049799 RepID=A0ABY8VL71_9CORY|nr:TRAM domain-containing protein [Corynebacterium breve]WIM68973.1 TRAM domain-containing protein [Corynebacterium breve]
MPEFTAGDDLTLTATSMAHGGEAIAHADDGRVVFVSGAVPGDTVTATVTKAKKRWARATTTAVQVPSEFRVEATCPAAAAGAGCCDYASIAGENQLPFKRDILIGQLASLAARSGVFEGFDSQQIEDHSLSKTIPSPWRTRVRFGVDSRGRAGVRKLQSNEIVTERCSQVFPDIYDELEKHSYTPGAEVIAVRDSSGSVHVVESARVPRGKRVETIEKVIAGTGAVEQVVGKHRFVFPATAFWQAHEQAPETYAEIIRTWGTGNYDIPVGWDLYGGVGVFVPAIAQAMGEDAKVISVDYSAGANASSQEALSEFNFESVDGRVEAVVDALTQPGLVVLDPPRSGAGAETVQAIAGKQPERIIHIGCDPATLARDLSDWGEAGYRVKKMAIIDAFPNTHHFEVMVELEGAGIPG